MARNEISPSESVNFPRKGLKNKLILTMIGVGTFPLVLAMVISYIQGNKSLQNVIGTSFQALAYETSTKIDFILQEEIRVNSRLATHPTIILTVQEHNRSTGDMDASETSSHFKEQAELWQKQDPKLAHLKDNSISRVLKGFLNRDSRTHQSTQALYVTDAKGVLVASINSFPDFLNAEEPDFAKTIAGGKDFVYLGELTSKPHFKGPLFHLALPIHDPDQKAIGVFHRIYLAKEFFSASIEPIVFGETGHVMMIDSHGVVIDCPILPTGFRLKDPNLVRSVTRPEGSWVLSNGNGHGTDELSIIGFAPLSRTNKITEGSTGLSWYTFTWQSSDELFAPTENLFLWISAAGFCSILLIALMGSLASNRIVQPIRLLQKTTARIGRGEDVEPLKIPTGDEIESLANEINTMNQMLRKSFSGLEEQVREKTKEVRSLQEYTESILRSVPDILIIFNEDLKIEYVNDAFKKLVNKSNDALVGKTLGELDLDLKDRWNFMARELSAYSQGKVNKKDRDTYSISTQPQKVQDPLAPKHAISAEETKTTVTLGTRIFAYQYFDVAITVEEKRRIGLLMKEISEEKGLQDQLAMAEKLSGLGTLAAGIAHEMNNPLYSIMGFTEAILEENDPSKIKNFANKVLARARHMASIILNMSGYSRASANDENRDVNVNERLDASIEMALMASVSNDIQMEKHYSTLPLLKAKPEEIQQIFLNIILNAVQAMEGKGKITITSSPDHGNIVTIIQDTGPGIPQEYLAKVFDPFFTTKEQGKGTGLGLNIVHRLVEKYGGHIAVESKLGSGTTFTVSFPCEKSNGEPK